MNRSLLVLAAVGFLASPLVVIAYGSAATTVLGRDLAAWARHDAALEMTRSLFASVDLYRRDHQRVPAEDAGLGTLVPKYVRNVPVDPWGNPFLYQSRGDWADVVSLGADGTAGGTGIASDVSARYGSPGTAAPRPLVGAMLATLIAIPLVAFAATYVRRGAGGVLAGAATFWAWVAAATVAPNADLSLALAGALAAIAAALFGATLSLRSLRGGATIALIGALGCLLATAAMMG